MPEAPAWQFKTVKRVPDRRPAPAKTVLKGRVYTGRRGGTIEDGFVRFEGGRITGVGAAGDLGSGADDAAVSDVDGTILPGLFNNHAHLGWDGANDLAAQALEDEPEISAYKCAANMLRSLRAGVTSVRDLGMNRTGFYAKQAIAQGVFDGPKLRICGEAIVQTGGHTYWCCREASGPDEMRRAVRDQVRDGADLIKIMGCHDRLEFTDEELDAVIDETHRNGLTITSHATYEDCIRRVVEHGVDMVEHGGSMTDETIQLLLDRDIAICTTFSPLVLQAKEGLAWGMPEWKVEERKRNMADKARFDGVVRAAKAGVPIIFGTDAGSPVVPHDAIVGELEFMVEIGICADNEAALVSITSLSAERNRRRRRPRRARGGQGSGRRRRRRRPGCRPVGDRRRPRGLPRRPPGRVMATAATIAERDERFARVRAAMAERELDALVVAGKGHWWTGRGYVRYLTDFHLWAHDALLVFPASGDPALAVTSYAVAGLVAERGWVTDTGGDVFLVPRTVRSLEDRSLTRGRIGLVGREWVLPAGDRARTGRGAAGGGARPGRRGPRPRADGQEPARDRAESRGVGARQGRHGALRRGRATGPDAARAVGGGVPRRPRRRRAGPARAHERAARVHGPAARTSRSPRTTSSATTWRSPARAATGAS